MKQKATIILKRLLSSDGFRIYFWPAFVLYLFHAGLLLLFLPMEPGSSREILFVCIGNVAILIFLWYLVFRYRRVKCKSVGKRCIVLLIIFSIICFLGLVLILVSELYLFINRRLV